MALASMSLWGGHPSTILVLTGVAVSGEVPEVFLAQAPYRCIRLFIVLGFWVPEILNDAFASSQVDTIHFCSVVSRYTGFSVFDVLGDW